MEVHPEHLIMLSLFSLILYLVKIPTNQLRIIEWFGLEGTLKIM